MEKSFQKGKRDCNSLNGSITIWFLNQTIEDLIN